MTLSELNSLSEEEFVDRVGLVMEDSPWVAARAVKSRPFGSIEDLHEALTREVEGSTDDEKLSLLRAHPDLGSRARMSKASVGEQEQVGLDRLSADEYNTLLELNSRYKEKFGFPFIYAVKGSTKHDIMAALRRRLESTQGTELNEALQQVFRIAKFRLAAIFSQGER